MKKRNAWLLLLASLGMMLTVSTTLPMTATETSAATVQSNQEGKLIKIEYKDNAVILVYRMPNGSILKRITSDEMEMAIVRDADKAHLTYYSEFKNSKVNNALKEAIYKWNKSLSPIGYHLSLVNDPSQAKFIVSDQLLTDPSTPSFATVNKDSNYNILSGKIQVSQFILDSSSQQIQSSFEHEIGHTIGQADTSMLK